jgi:hypothetical protein
VEINNEIILYRIINGYYCISINDIKYKILLPNINIKQQAYIIYSSILNDHRFETDSWLTQDNIDHLLKKYDLWDNTKENSYKELFKKLDHTKIEYFLNFNHSTNKESLKKSIITINSSIDKATGQKHYFDHLTLDHYAQSIKNQYLICSTVYKEDGSKVFDDIEDVNTTLLDKILLEIYENSLGTEDIKKIARCELWKSYWGSSKENIFPGCVKDWTDEQRSLVNFTKTLDSIREHMEAPAEEVIEDNYALDGWILYQHEKIAKEKKQKNISEKYGLDKKNNNEIFLMSSNIDDTKEILSLNDKQNIRDMNEMISVVNKSDKKIDWAQLPHVKRELINKQQELTKNQRG